MQNHRLDCTGKSCIFICQNICIFTCHSQGPVEGGSTPAVVEGNVAILELLRLFGEARSIINRDAGKILRIDCEILQADIRNAREMQQSTGLPGQML